MRFRGRRKIGFVTVDENENIADQALVSPADQWLPLNRAGPPAEAPGAIRAIISE